MATINHISSIGVRLLFTFLFLFFLSLGEGWGEALAQDFRGAFHIVQKEFREQNDSLHISFNITIDARVVPSCSAMI
ncbi:hypothetical protein D0T60_12910, partial [Bacteroides sp. 224]